MIGTVVSSDCALCTHHGGELPGFGERQERNHYGEKALVQGWMTDHNFGPNHIHHGSETHRGQGRHHSGKGRMVVKVGVSGELQDLPVQWQLWNPHNCMSSL
jgi:hypothetical protein